MAFALLIGTAAPSWAVLSKAEEREIGRKVLEEVRREFRLLEDPALLAYLDGVGQRLAKAGGVQAFATDFHVVADSRVNAFAVPGGHVFLTSQTVLLCEDESELAGVVAHELGHVEGRHIAHRVEASSRVNLATLAAILAAAFLTRSPQAGAAITTFALAGAQTKMLQYSRTDEEDADRRALRTLTTEGYDGWGLVRFMETIRRHSPTPEGIPAYLFTHPLPENRSTYLAQALEGAPPAAKGTPAVGPLWRAQARVLAEDPRPWGLSLLQERAKRHPESADAQLGLGVGLRAAGRSTDAEKALAEAAALAPDDPEIRYETAKLWLGMGRSAAAIDALEALRRAGKATEAVLRDLGWAYLEADRGEKALEVYDELARRPEEAARWEKLDYYRGLALGRTGREGEGHAALGDYYRKTGEADLATRHYQEALRLLEPGSLRERVAETLGGEGAKGR